MTIDEQLNALERIIKLIVNIEKWPDFLHKDEIVQRLQWTAKNLSETIWSQQLADNK